MRVSEAKAVPNDAFPLFSFSTGCFGVTLSVPTEFHPCVLGHFVIPRTRGAFGGLYSALIQE